MISESDLNNNILMNIEILRAELIKSGIENGLDHPITIDLSQQLDNLLNEYKFKQK